MERMPILRTLSPVSRRPARLFQMIISGPVVFPSCVSLRAQQCVLRMLDRNPATRANAAEILMDPWVALPDAPRCPAPQHDQGVPMSVDSGDHIVPDVDHIPIAAAPSPPCTTATDKYGEDSEELGVSSHYHAHSWY